ncbi:hypothetical protein H312_00537 [Anncaliia algerae PRA339]|uniref:Uncharacterized protein n=1 Tax=Anncaliia algerae PRA339 TaxID=1288291 RepID=A0A059F4G5_9MICR|nr:hypothetical protein H312_00537 [Anncaliia algerae PRA339]
MVERTSKRRIILIPLENRKSQRSINIIKKYIHPESFIYTDCWKDILTLKKNLLLTKL